MRDPSYHGTGRDISAPVRETLRHPRETTPRRPRETPVHPQNTTPTPLDFTAAWIVDNQLPCLPLVVAKMAVAQAIGRSAHHQRLTPWQQQILNVWHKVCSEWTVEFHVEEI
jgi:hypothetical protein